MKIYDKEVYNRQEEVRNVIIVIVSFLLGFFVGYMANTVTKTDGNANVINNLDASSVVNQVQSNQTQENQINNNKTQNNQIHNIEIHEVDTQGNELLNDDAQSSETQNN